jgi:hypothetical protein
MRHDGGVIAGVTLDCGALFFLPKYTFESYSVKKCRFGLGIEHIYFYCILQAYF